MRLGQKLLLLTLALSIFSVPACAGKNDGTSDTKTGEDDLGSNLDRERPITIISDVDDTIKITGVKMNWGEMFSNLDDGEEFAGMSLLYSHLQNMNAKTRTFYYVSGAPTFIGIYKYGQEFLHRFNYPNKENYLYRSSILRHTEDFKVRTIETLIRESSPDTKFLLIGDNGEKDPVVYKRITEMFPDRIIATFMHQTYMPESEKFKILDGQIPYFTSVDLAIQLAKMDLIGLPQVGAVAEQAKFLLGSNPETLSQNWTRTSCVDFTRNQWPKDTLPSGIASRVEDFYNRLILDEDCR